MAKVSYILKVFCSKKCCVQAFLLLFFSLKRVFGAVSTMLGCCGVGKFFLLWIILSCYASMVSAISMLMATRYINYSERSISYGEWNAHQFKWQASMEIHWEGYKQKVSRSCLVQSRQVFVYVLHAIRIYALLCRDVTHATRHATEVSGVRHATSGIHDRSCVLVIPKLS